MGEVGITVDDALGQVKGEITSGRLLDQLLARRLTSSLDFLDLVVRFDLAELRLGQLRDRRQEGRGEHLLSLRDAQAGILCFGLCRAFIDVVGDSVIVGRRGKLARCHCPHLDRLSWRLAEDLQILVRRAGAEGHGAIVLQYNTILLASFGREGLGLLTNSGDLPTTCLKIDSRVPTHR